MEKIGYFIWLAFVLRTATSQSIANCVTPNDLNGICININSCPVLRAMLRTQSRKTVAFLLNSGCGYEGTVSKVCCGLNDFKTSTKLPSLYTCGQTNVTSNRVVGGSPAELGAWPWMTRLGYRDRSRRSREYLWQCGGSLISDRYVLTAAHCIVGIQDNLKLVVVRLGDLNSDPNVDDGARPIDILIRHAMPHENYNESDNTNDIALLKLKKHSIFNKLVQPICLPILPHHRSNLLVGMKMFIAGWGAKKFRGEQSNILMQLPVPVLDNSECKRAFVKYNSNSVIDERVICAGYIDGGKDSCQGDSGGPVMMPIGKQYYLVGVVSYGYNCTEPDYPAVYTRVSEFVDWIGTKMDS